MTTPDVGWLRKAVEWVESQDALPEIDSEWAQGNYLSPPGFRAVALVHSAMPWLVATPHQGQLIIERIAPYCGTAYCVANWVAAQVEPEYRHAEVVDEVHCSEFAKRVLGLTDHQAAMLFNAGNTAADIRTYAEAFAGEPL